MFHWACNNRLSYLYIEESLTTHLLSSECRYKLYPQPYSLTAPLPTELHLPSDVSHYLTHKSCTIEDRCLVASYIYGDRFSIDFWTLASHYLKKAKIDCKNVQSLDSEVSGIII